MHLVHIYDYHCGPREPSINSATTYQLGII